MVDFKKLSKDIKLRKLAEEVQREIQDSFLEELTEEERVRFWEYLMKTTDAWPRQEVKDTPMDYEEAMEWGAEHTMVFGQYVGNKIVDVPSGYLLWLDSQPDFRRMLRKYLSSSYFHRIQEKEERE